MKKYFTLFVTFSLFITINTSAQLTFLRNSSTVVLNILGDTLKNPWAGGFNSVQFSEIDLNIDGRKDLISFDRTGNRLATFINNGTPNTVDYTHDPQYIQNFPTLTNWVLLRDYNCDGKMDIFTSYSGGIRIYKNTSTTVLSFVLADSILLSNYQPDSAPIYIPLYVSSVDIPAIDDIDGDGDLDILTFNAQGTNIEYHKNLSIENNNTCDSLTYELRNKCWGFVKENSNSNTVTLYDTCSFNNNNPETNIHAGSTLLTMDVDASGSKDLILGDVSSYGLTLLRNSDSSPNLTSSLITSQDTTFPANNLNTIATDIDIFPAGFYIDVNNDNVKDLITVTNCLFNCANTKNVWFYENNNLDNNPDFDYVTNSFLQEGMIEVGEGANPRFFDYNADGLMDIVIGNYGVYDTTAAFQNEKSSLWLYKNIGTLLNPAYQLIDKDYVKLSTMNLDVLGNIPTIRLVPTFGDIDGDGDKDMLVGDYWGYLHYFENTAGVGNPANFILNQAQYAGINIGYFAAPQLIDLNRDLLLDLVIGERNGSFRYYQNIGTSIAPNFSLITNTLGNVNTKRSYEYNGNSVPFIYDDAGSYKMLAGATNGFIYQFGNIDGNLTGTFSKDSSYLNIWEGSNSSIGMGDNNGDGYLDLLVGNYSGGVAYYRGDFTTAVKEKASNLTEINIYPNPAYNTINIDLGTNDINNASIQLLDLVGKTIYNQTVTNSKVSFDLNNLSQGVYLIMFKNNLGIQVRKMVKK